MPGTMVSPVAYYKLLSSAIHECGSESLEDRWLQAYNECSTGQTSIYHCPQEIRGVREIEGAQATWRLPL